MNASTMNSRICPECGAENSSVSLFCAECGGSLNSAVANQSPAPNVGYDTTQATATQPYVPASQPSQMTYAAQPAAQPSQDSWTPAASYPLYDEAPLRGHVPRQESVRGMVLGWIATILMLAILGFYLWSSVIDDSLRDRITGLFG